MKEAKLILPQYDNSGNPLNAQRVRIESSLLDHFGGYSATQSVGVWRDPKTNKTYHEESITYVITADWSDVANADHLRWIAQNAAESIAQECIYMALPDGVEFIQPYAVAIAA